MITSEIRLYIIIGLFLLVLTRGHGQCTLWMVDLHLAANMPLAYRVNKQQRPYLVYPDGDERLTIEPNGELVLSCVSNTFAAPSLNDESEITVTCLGGSLLRYKEKNYTYADFTCKHTPWTTVVETDEKCNPNNNTVLTVGFKTRKHYFTMFRVCFDMVTKNTLYTWFNVRWPYYDKRQYINRSRVFTQHKGLYGDLNVEVVYSQSSQRKTINKILSLPEDSDKFINRNTFLTRGHFAAKPDFYYAREQRATFIFVNAAPQWHQLNVSWMEIETVLRNKLIKNSHHRRVIVAGSYGVCRAADVNNVQRPLYLVMPEKQLAVPMFLWKLYYDADDEQNNVVFIGMNNPYATDKEFNNSKLRCDEIPCPGGVPIDKRTRVLRPYCCTIESFQRVYGKLKPEVFSVPQVPPDA